MDHDIIAESGFWAALLMFGESWWWCFYKFGSDLWSKALEPLATNGILPSRQHKTASDVRETYFNTLAHSNSHALTPLNSHTFKLSNFHTFKISNSHTQTLTHLHSRTNTQVGLTPLTIGVFTTLQSDPRDFWPLRHLIRQIFGRFSENFHFFGKFSYF